MSLYYWNCHAMIVRSVKHLVHVELVKEGVSRYPFPKSFPQFYIGYNNRKGKSTNRYVDGNSTNDEGSTQSLMEQQLKNRPEQLPNQQNCAI